MKSTIVVEVTQEEDGGFIAEGLTENIFTQADTWAELKENVIEAVTGYYFDQPLVPNIKLHSKELVFRTIALSEWGHSMVFSERFLCIKR